MAEGSLHSSGKRAGEEEGVRGLAGSQQRLLGEAWFSFALLCKERWKPEKSKPLEVCHADDRGFNNKKKKKPPSSFDRHRQRGFFGVSPPTRCGKFVRAQFAADCAWGRRVAVGEAASWGSLVQCTAESNGVSGYVCVRAWYQGWLAFKLFPKLFGPNLTLAEFKRERERE